MAQASRIEWTEYSWNPVTGCTKVSPGCMNCYAERMALRLHAMGVKRYQAKFKVSIHPELLSIPFKWKEPRIIFVNSMGDLFHEEVPEKFILDVFATMNKCQRHIYQVLTKRSLRLLKLSEKISWTENIWMGVTVEEERFIDRIKHLRDSKARIKFISCEPLLSSINELPLEGIDWVIVGGESGPNARPMEKNWATSIRDQCLSAKVSYFFKQWGGWDKKKNGRVLEGKIWNQLPAKS